MEENLRVKQQIIEELFPSPAATLSVSVDENHSTSPSSHQHTPLLAVVDTSFTRIETIATSTSSTTVTTSSDNFDVTPPTASTDTTTIDYDSDRTDFLATQPSPCPRKSIEDFEPTDRTHKPPLPSFDNNKEKEPCTTETRFWCLINSEDLQQGRERNKDETPRVLTETQSLDGNTTRIFMCNVALVQTRCSQFCKDLQRGFRT